MITGSMVGRQDSGTPSLVDCFVKRECVIPRLTDLLRRSHGGAYTNRALRVPGSRRLRARRVTWSPVGNLRGKMRSGNALQKASTRIATRAHNTLRHCKGGVFADAEMTACIRRTLISPFAWAYTYAPQHKRDRASQWKRETSSLSPVWLAGGGRLPRCVPDHDSSGDHKEDRDPYNHPQVYLGGAPAKIDLRNAAAFLFNRHDATDPR